MHDQAEDENFMLDKLKFVIFILVSSSDFKINNVLSIYYNRQSIEQFFDYIKNKIDILPLRTLSEETLAKHIFMSFLASIGFVRINKMLKIKNLSFNNSIDSLKRFNYKIFSSRIVLDVPTKKINDISKALKVKISKKTII
jgi:hypothetical protein